MRILILMLIGLNTVFAAPYNSNILIERGIDPQIINLAVTTFRQKVAYKMRAEYSKSINGAETKQDFNIIFDPFASYGIDVRIQVPKADMDKYDAGDIREELDQLMGLQSYLLTDKLYDENSLQIESSSNETTIVLFKFNANAIPREMKYFEDLTGRIYIKNNIMEKIVLSNDIRFKRNDVEVTNYTKTMFFTKVPMNGGYLLKQAEVIIEGEKDGVIVNANIKGEVVKYWNQGKQAVSWRSGAQKRAVVADADSEKYHTIFVELDRTFPLLGQDARKLGYDLPKPFGVSLVTMFQNTTLHMTSFEVDGNDSLTTLLGGSDSKSKYESVANAALVRADMWLLPFLNLGILLGGVDSTTDVTLAVTDDLPPLLGGGSETQLPPFGTSSVLYGAGITVAGGVGNFFATIDLQHITAYTEAAEVDLSMTIATPIFGYSFQDLGLRLLVGAQYQDMKEELTATVNLDGNDATPENEILVGLRSEKWAGLIGVEKGFNRHWNGSLMYSSGEDRGSFNMMLGYRF